MRFYPRIVLEKCRCERSRKRVSNSMKFNRFDRFSLAREGIDLSEGDNDLSTIRRQASEQEKTSQDGEK